MGMARWQEATTRRHGGPCAVAARKSGPRAGARYLTALSGARTIGFAQCKNFRGHINNHADVDPAFAAQLKANCSSSPGPTDSNLAPLDVQTELDFDNTYQYGNLIARRGLLHSAQELFNGGSQDALVQQYSSNSTIFFADFVVAMMNMGNITPLTGSAGQIMLNCRAVNS